MSKFTVNSLKAMKGKEKIVCLTAYDYSTAQIVDKAGLQIVLVGDSLGMTMLGYETTVPVTMDDMMHHTTAVARGVKDALVVADMPFLSYQVSIEEAILNAGMFLKDAGADAVKIEGGAFRAPVVKALVENGIPVLGHIGMTPQSVNTTGGYKVQGKKDDDAASLIEDAKALEQAGAFGIVIECVPSALGKAITEAVEIPTIGIGAGRDCDGQILVIHDLLGIESGVSPKFVKRYANLGDEMKKAFEAYKGEVEDGTFPGTENEY